MAPQCAVCDAPALFIVPGYENLARITSDCKPWPAGGTLAVCEACGAMQKPPDDQWLSETRAIYDRYEVYHQSDGVEQAVFNPSGEGERRSARLMGYLTDVLKLPKHGAYLDVGCANGRTLAEFSLVRPAWLLFGQDVNSRNLGSLRRIANFRELFTCPLERISARFDLISFIHSLEHFAAPRQALNAIQALLSETAHLFVEVPDAAANPFDLLVADHRMHFTRQTLEALLRRAGFRTVTLVDSLISKELTVVGQRAKRRMPVSTDTEHGRRLAVAHVLWLQRVVADAARIAASSSRFGLFGSSVSAIWLKGVLQDRVQFFVDDDPARIGRSIFGCPVYAAKDVQAGSDVFVPLIPAISANVIRRIRHLPFRLHTTPPLGCGK